MQTDIPTAWTTSDVVKIGSKTMSWTCICLSPNWSELYAANFCWFKAGRDVCNLSPPPNQPPDQDLVHSVCGEKGEEPLCDPNISLGVELLTEDSSSRLLNVAAKMPSRMDIRKPRMKIHWFCFGLISSRSGCHSISTQIKEPISFDKTIWWMQRGIIPRNVQQASSLRQRYLTWMSVVRLLQFPVQNMYCEECVLEPLPIRLKASIDIRIHSLHESPTVASAKLFVMW